MKEKKLLEAAGRSMHRLAASDVSHVSHTFEPVYNSNSRVLILGTFPSVKSREGNFYYHHPQNRFWKLIAALTHATVPETILQKKEMLLKANIAVWDVVAECDIIGSSDASIQNVIPTDINRILTAANIVKIYANGAKAAELYHKYLEPVTGRPAVKLPSTSPANAACSFERLKEDWGRELAAAQIGGISKE